MFLIAVICVPIMLLPKPIYEIYFKDHGEGHDHEAHYLEGGDAEDHE